MLRAQFVRLGVHRTTYTSAQTLPIACNQRWDLRLTKAKLWNEYIDADDKHAWQVEDERHMSPEFATSFVGFPMRHMKPGEVSANRPNNIVRRRLPNLTHHEMSLRRDLPFQQNAMMGKSLYDKTIHGIDVPYPYALFKSLKKGYRNDRTLKQNKFKIMIGQGVKNPPANYVPLADEGSEKDE